MLTWGQMGSDGATWGGGRYDLTQELEMSKTADICKIHQKLMIFSMNVLAFMPRAHVCMHKSSPNFLWNFITNI